MHSFTRTGDNATDSSLAHIVYSTGLNQEPLKEQHNTEDVPKGENKSNRESINYRFRPQTISSSMDPRWSLVLRNEHATTKEWHLIIFLLLCPIMDPGSVTDWPERSPIKGCGLVYPSGVEHSDPVSYAPLQVLMASTGWCACLFKGVVHNNIRRKRALKLHFPSWVKKRKSGIA